MLVGIGRIAYPLVIVSVVGTTWCFAWARSVRDQSARAYWPAKDPELIRRVLSLGSHIQPVQDDADDTLEQAAEAKWRP